MVQIYFTNFNTNTIVTNFFAVFMLLFFKFFPPGSGSRWEMDADPDS